MLWHWFCPNWKLSTILLFYHCIYKVADNFSVYMSVLLSVGPSLLSGFMSVCLSVAMSVFLPVRLSFCLYVCPFFCLSVILSIFPSICSFVCPSVHLFVCPSKLYLCQIVKNWHQTHQVNISNIHVLNVTQNFKLNPIWRLIKWINMSM